MKPQPAGPQAGPGHNPPPPPHYEYRVHPFYKDYVSYKYVCHYFDPGFHYFGYRIKRLPPRAYRIPCHGIQFYCYDGIYYRLHDSHYIVCRPPYETVIALEMMRQLQLNAVRLRYYNTVIRSYNAVNNNNKYIVEQNATIAKNNAIIAEQQRIIAENEAKIAAQNAHMKYVPSIATTTLSNEYVAVKAYETAQAAGLVQNYASAGVNYYYQDGVFYVIENNQYKVIIPPAGALVEYLPEDYNTVVLAGESYYEVDGTIYRTTTLDGTAYFEVVGQINA